MRMGKALSQSGYREKVFLMTKIDGRGKEEATRQIETSLQWLKTDRIDLLQHHEILRFDDADRIFAEGGAMEAFLAAKQAGKIRFIGFTGHKDPRIHLYMLERAAKNGFKVPATTVRASRNAISGHSIVMGIAGELPVTEQSSRASRHRSFQRGSSNLALVPQSSSSSFSFSASLASTRIQTLCSSFTALSGR